MVRKRRRKKLPVPERQPLVRPTQPNEVWSMDFLFDELANGRRVKALTVVDDCSKESVQIVADTSIPALYVTRVLDQVKAQRGLPKVIRTDNGPEFAGRTMQTWAARNGVELRFIQPGKPVQNAYIESFNSRFRDECLSQHWFASLSHMRSVIDTWRDDYNHHRPHSTLGTCRRPCSPRSAASSLAALRKPPHQLRCKTLGSRSKCYESWGQRTATEGHTVRRQAAGVLEDLPGWANTVIGDLLSELHGWTNASRCTTGTLRRSPVRMSARIGSCSCMAWARPPQRRADGPCTAAGCVRALQRGASALELEDEVAARVQVASSDSGATLMNQAYIAHRPCPGMWGQDHDHVATLPSTTRRARRYSRRCWLLTPPCRGSRGLPFSPDLDDVALHALDDLEELRACLRWRMVLL